MNTEKNYLRGHEIEEVEGHWVYSDTKLPTVPTWENTACGECNKPFTKEGHDPCLGTLPNVSNACCGHGTDSEAYVQLESGDTLRGEEAMEYIKNSSKESK